MKLCMNLNEYVTNFLTVQILGRVGTGGTLIHT
jgi:hypothetical protein